MDIWQHEQQDDQGHGRRRRREYQVCNADVLNAAGYETLTVSTGLECLSRVVAEQPDIILLDVHMPEHDSFAVASRLTAEESGKLLRYHPSIGGV